MQQITYSMYVAVSNLYQKFPRFTFLLFIVVLVVAVVLIAFVVAIFVVVVAVVIVVVSATLSPFHMIAFSVARFVQFTYLSKIHSQEVNGITSSYLWCAPWVRTKSTLSLHFTGSGSIWVS